MDGDAAAGEATEAEEACVADEDPVIAGKSEPRNWRTCDNIEAQCTRAT